MGKQRFYDISVKKLHIKFRFQIKMEKRIKEKSNPSLGVVRSLTNTQNKNTNTQNINTNTQNKTKTQINGEVEKNPIPPPMLAPPRLKRSDL